MAVFLKLIFAFAVLYAVLVFGAWYLQRHLMYHPDTLRSDPSVFGLGNIKEIKLETPDGETVVCWWGKASPGKPTLLYFHGNAGTLSTRSERIRNYHQRGYGMLMMTYRGFGGSTGQPSERANVRDAKLAYDWLIRQGVTADQIVVYGESLGSGVAVQLAAAKPLAGVILDAPYTSMVDVAVLHYPYLPARWFLIDRYVSRNFIGKINAPLLIVHGDQDAIIPVVMGNEMFRLAKEPKELAVIAGAGHADHYMFGSYDKIFNWLDRLDERRSSRAAE